MLKPIFFN